MSAETMTKIKVFFLPDYEKEEKYLSEMHAKGWRLDKINLFKYTFVKCTPEKVVYKIDFAGEKTDVESYKTIFSDYGWEYIQDLNDFSYFRKNADGISESDSEIFSDNESRLEMVNKILTNKFKIIAFLYISELLIFMPLLLGDNASDLMMILFAVVFVIMTCILSYNFVGLMKIKKKLKNI